MQPDEKKDSLLKSPVVRVLLALGVVGVIGGLVELVVALSAATVQRVPRQQHPLSRSTSRSARPSRVPWQTSAWPALPHPAHAQAAPLLPLR